jgi:SPP1 family predicted phage head-tail adaptor
MGKCKYICLGGFNHKIEILSRSINSSSLNASEDFVLIKTTRAKIETVNKSTEFFDGVNLTNSYTHKFTIHYSSGITSENWIRIGTILYRILNVENLDNMDKYLILGAKQTGVNTIAASFN